MNIERVAFPIVRPKNLVLGLKKHEPGDLSIQARDDSDTVVNRSGDMCRTVFVGVPSNACTAIMFLENGSVFENA